MHLVDTFDRKTESHEDEVFRRSAVLANIGHPVNAVLPIIWPGTAPQPLSS